MFCPVSVQRQHSRVTAGHLGKTVNLGQVAKAVKRLCWRYDKHLNQVHLKVLLFFAVMKMARLAAQ